MKGAPRSKQFDDIYFSQDDGLAESEFVFLKGNGLPESWEDKPNFTIAETGFGTGLNFLAVWDMFEKHATPAQRLDFVSFEKYPLSVDEIKAALAPWENSLGDKITLMLEAYPMRVPGVHCLAITENVFLTLIFDDVNEALPQLSGYGVDAWFLDGFNPAKNPDMWTQTVFDHMARLSCDGCTFATFTAAGFVKRGLQDAGFIVEKTPGYGRKRERLIGHVSFDNKRKKMNSIRSVAIIGGGLAGTAAAYWFQKQGLVPTIYEGSDCLGYGASGNERGMVNPRISKLRNAESDFYMQAFAMALREMKLLSHDHDIDFVQCGALHLMHNDDMRARYPSMVEHWGWDIEHARIIQSEEASQIAGVSVDYDALHLPNAAMVNPRKLCTAYASGVNVHYNTCVTDVVRQGSQWLVNGEVYDAVILASAMGVENIKQSQALSKKVDLYPVRGQMSFVPQNDVTSCVETILNYRGYFSPALGGVHALGSTFDREDMSLDLRDDDHKENMYHLESAVPAIAGHIKTDGGRAALRVATKHRFPLFDEVAPNMYVSTAHGSHGLVSTIQCASILCNRLCSGLKLYK